MSVKLLNREEFANIKDKWNELLQQSSNNDFFLTWEWIFTWWEVYGGNKELFILLVKNDNGELLGIAPWYIKKCRINFIGSGENLCSEYLNIITKVNDEEYVVGEIFDYLVDNKSKWSELFLVDVLENHNIVNLIYKKAKREDLPFYREKVKIPCVCMPLPDSSDLMWRGLSKKFRFHIRWGRKKIEENANSAVKFFFQEHIPQQDMENMFALHNKRMEEKGLKGKFDLRDYGLFHRILLNRASKNKALSLLEVDGKTIGMIYGFHYRNKIYIYQAGFDPDSEYKKYSIGQILYSYMIEKAIELKCEEFDFLRGDEKHKLKWTDSLKMKEKLHIFNKKTFKGKLSNFKYQAKEKIKTILKKVLRKK